MKRLIYPILAIALMPQVPAVAQYPVTQYPQAQPQPVYSVPYLAAALADGTPFVVQLHPGESNGTLIGGQTYLGIYNPDSETFTVSGPGRRPEDGVVIPVTATYAGGDPLRQEVSLWGAFYTFDPRGNLFLGNSGRLAGYLALRR